VVKESHSYNTRGGKIGGSEKTPSKAGRGRETEANYSQAVKGESSGPQDLQGK